MPDSPSVPSLQEQVEAEVLTRATLNAARLLGLTPAELAGALQYTRAGVLRLQGGNLLLAPGPVWANAVTLVKIYRALTAVTGTPATARTWLESPHPALAKRSPLELLAYPAGRAELLAYLEAARHAPQ